MSDEQVSRLPEPVRAALPKVLAVLFLLVVAALALVATGFLFWGLAWFDTNVVYPLLGEYAFAALALYAVIVFGWIKFLFGLLGNAGRGNPLYRNDGERRFAEWYESQWRDMW